MSILHGVIAVACLFILKWTEPQFDGTEDAWRWVLGFSAGVAYLCGQIYAGLGVSFGMLAFVFPDRRRAFVVAMIGIILSGSFFALMPRPSTRQAPATTARPAAVVAPVASPIPEAETPEVVYLQGFAALNQRLDANLKCSMEASRRRGVAHGDFGPIATRADIDQLHAVAQRIAPDELAMMESYGTSTNKVDRVNRYFGAIGEYMLDESHPELPRLVAKAWLAYYQGLPADGECPLEPDLLSLIDKTP
jgi:hypothetical protein